MTAPKETLADRITRALCLNPAAIAVEYQGRSISCGELERAAQLIEALLVAAGFARGCARVGLTESAGGGTLLTYNVEALIGGKLAQLGGLLINGVVKKLADEFFANFARQFET